MNNYIVGLGGGGFSTDTTQLGLEQHILQLTNKDNPKVCFLPTASGDAQNYIDRFYAAFGSLQCQPTHLALFYRTRRQLQEFILEQDVIYVGGGNTLSMLGVWRAHGLLDILRQAYAAGTILCGLSAGMNCWFDASITDSFGGDVLEPLHDGLGIIGGSCCPHYDGEPGREPTYTHLIKTGIIPAGYAVDDNVAVVFANGQFQQAVTTRSGAGAWHVSADTVQELPVMLLDW